MRPEHDAPIEHELKCWPPYYGEIACGRKTFEVRLNDREFRTADVLRLREFDPQAEGGLGSYTGREIRKMVGYAMYGADEINADMEARLVGIAPGHVVLSLVPTVDESAAKRAAWDARLHAQRELDGMPPLGERERFK